MRRLEEQWASPPSPTGEAVLRVANPAICHLRKPSDIIENRTLDLWGSRITPASRRLNTLTRLRQKERKGRLPLGAAIFSISGSKLAEPTVFRDTQGTPLRESVLDVLKAFGRETSIHGVRYFCKPGLGVAERLCWVAAVLICTFFACTCVSSVLYQFWKNPMLVTVETTNYPLHNVPFPTITICPANKIKRKLAEKLLLRFLNTTDPGSELLMQLGHFLSALSKLQHPFYFRATEHLEQAANILPALGKLNISQFMLKVLPTCEEIFQDCFWQGSPVDCCITFHIQRSEVGFCYSFNSLTSDMNQNCHSSNTKGSSMDSDQSQENVQQECKSHMNTASGTTTGLEIFLKNSSKIDLLEHGQRDTSGYRIYVNSPDTFPEAGNSWLVPEGQSHVFTMKISPSVTMSSPAVKALQPRDRRCYFRNEHRLDIYPTYTQSSCLIECRLRYIAAVCQCAPYFFNSCIKSVPQCNSTQLKCIADHNLDLRLYSLPAGVAKFRHNTSPLNCSGCLASCDRLHYQLDTSYEPDSNNYSSIAGAYVDIYYGHLGAVKYHQQLAFDGMQLLVSCGGIAGLFLGISLLTVAELLYYIISLTKIFFRCIVPLHSYSSVQTIPRKIQIS